MSTELERWIVEQRDAGAAVVDVRPARSDKDFATVDLATTDDPDAGIDGVCKDSLRERKMASGSFKLTARGETYRRTRTIVVQAGAADVAEAKGESDNAATVKALSVMVKDLCGSVVDLAKNNDVKQLAADLAVQLVAMQASHAETLASAFEMASLKREMINDDEQRKVTRDVLVTVAKDLAPVAGAIVSHAMNKAGPAFAALLGSLSPEQQKALEGILTKGQLASLGAIISAVVAGDEAPDHSTAPESAEGAAP